MELDVSQVMSELCNTLDNFWYPAHLLDLLHHSGNLESNLGQQNEYLQAGASLREFLLLEYATCLMTHHSLWQVGVLYFDHCPVQGRHRLELLLERVPLTSEKKAEKILSIANERGVYKFYRVSNIEVCNLKVLKNIENKFFFENLFSRKLYIF